MISADLEGVNSQSIKESHKLISTTTATQLRDKHAQIAELDTVIAAKIQTETDLEEEICNADTYLSMLEKQITFLTEFIYKANLPPQSTVSPLPTTMSPPPVSLLTSAADTQSNTPGASLTATTPARVSATNLQTHAHHTTATSHTHLKMLANFLSYLFPHLVETPYSGKHFGTCLMQL